MNKMRICIGIMVTLLVIVGYSIAAYAATEFSTQDMADDKAEEFCKNVNIIKSIEKPEMMPIECFDVNDDGMYVLGHSNVKSDLLIEDVSSGRISDRKVASVYNAEGVFQYCYYFFCSGSFGLELLDDGLMIYFTRSSVAVELNILGEIKSVREILDTIDNNSYWNNVVYHNERQLNDIKYILKNDVGILDLFTSNYSQLIIRDEGGNEKVVYDVSFDSNKRMILSVLGVVLLVIVVLISIIRQMHKKRRRETI